MATSKSKPEKPNTGKEDALIDVGGAPPREPSPPAAIMSPAEWEKLLQEETARFNLPLALRKSRRATAGMKYTISHDEDLALEEELLRKPVHQNKESKLGGKRKLEASSAAGSSGSKGKGEKKHKHKQKESESVEDYVPPFSKKQKIHALRDQDSRNDFYCWYCHKEGSVICCELCPRVYHTRCLKYQEELEGDWVCPVCQKVLESECVDTQSKSMAKLSVSQLSRLLNFALKRMKHQGTDSFQKPVSLQQFPDYASYVFNPMDLGTLEENIKKNVYGSTYAFLEETKWILHNCIIFNGSHHKLTNRAKSIVKICDYEMNEIEICPNCYLSSCLKRENWFCEPCDPPHMIVWAKLQGFPYWQAKVLRESKGQVDVRFFGQHDRAWIPMSNCFLVSKESPITTKKQQNKLANASRELKIYVENITAKYGSFEYYPQRTAYKPGMTAPTNAKSPNFGKKTAAKPTKPLSGKPAAFMNGIREAEAAAAQQDDEMDDDDEESPDPEESRSGVVRGKERVSVDDDSFDSVSLGESSQWSVGSSQTSEKQDTSMSSEKTVVADCSQSQKTARMGGMGPMVRKPVVKTSPKDVHEYLAKSIECAKKKLMQGDCGSLSKRAIPTGVFEISDQTLDIDEEKKSPSVQLLGKVHVSPQHRKRNLEKSFDKSEESNATVFVATTVSPKKHQSTCEKGRTEESKDSNKCEKDALPVKVKVEPKSAIGADGDSGSSSVSSSLQSIILPSKLPDPSALDEAAAPKTPPEASIPSTSKTTPRSSDKFHLKLSKTIENMKASLGVEGMETNENSESESESEEPSPRGAQDDSESSDEEMEVEGKIGKETAEVKGQMVQQKEKEAQGMAKEGEDNPSEDPKAADKDEETSSSQKADKEFEDQSDCGLAMSVNSADDQSESELVIDMDRAETGGVGKDSASKESVDKPDVETEIAKDDKSTDEQSKRTDSDNNAKLESSSSITSKSKSVDSTKLTVTETSTDFASNLPKLTPKSPTPPTFINIPSTTIKQVNTAPPVVVSPVLASQKMAEMVQQKEKESQKMAEELITAAEKQERTDHVEKQSNVLNVASASGSKVETDVKQESEMITKKEEDYPLVEEDPLKAWGNADELLEKYSSQIAECVKESLMGTRRDLIESIVSLDTRKAIEQLQSQVTRLTWEKEKQKRELQHVMDLTIAEMRESLNSDLKSCELNTKKEAQKELDKAVRETKKKQWCAQCEQEAFFYCCWNTSYCFYTCQQKHWTAHQNACQQQAVTTQNKNDNTQAIMQPSASSTAPSASVTSSIAMITSTTSTSSSAPTTLMATSTGAADRLRIISTQAAQGQNQPMQIITPAVTAAQSSSTPQVQTLIRYVTQPPRMPMQGGVQGAPQTTQLIRFPVGTTLQNVGGQQRIVLSSQSLQNLKAKQQPLTGLPSVMM